MSSSLSSSASIYPASTYQTSSSLKRKSVTRSDVSSITSKSVIPLTIKTPSIFRLVIPTISFFLQNANVINITINYDKGTNEKQGFFSIFLMFSKFYIFSWL